MTKKVLLVLLLALMFPLSAFAATKESVVDQANLLLYKDEENLRSQIAKLVDMNKYDVVIVTVYSLEGKSPKAFADDYFDNNGYGIGPDRDGILFLISPQDSDWAISTSGACIGMFTSNEIDQMAEEFIPRLASGDFDKAISTFVELIGKYDSKLDTAFLSSLSGLWLTIVGFFSFLVSLAIVSKVKNRVGVGEPISGSSAARYMVLNSFKDTINKNVFKGTETDRRAIETRSSYHHSSRHRTRRHHSHSSSHRSSSRAHGGSSGKF
ncbi:MAG: TPM domain-containing protein [Clostridiales bacterium]|jgi:uncharacterized protein|nr:TPM domain-containing protein [Clostridiales bacterium]